MTSHADNVINRTDPEALRKEFQSLSRDSELNGLHARGLQETLSESVVLDRGDRTLLARVISITNGNCPASRSSSSPR